jgi:hypothetical protein
LDVNTIDIGRRSIAICYQGEPACRLVGRLLDVGRIRRVIRPLMTRQAVIIVHVNRRCQCVSGSWYGRAKSFNYFNCRYQDFDGDVITLVVNPDWISRQRVAHGPYYLAAARRFGRYPRQRPLDAIIYVLTHEFAHHFLFACRHPMRFSERATDLFTLQHLHRLEPGHPIARHVRLTNRELGLLLELLRQMPSGRRRQIAARRVACKRKRRRGRLANASAGVHNIAR